jgi:ParB family chromosome partitioning protein
MEDIIDILVSDVRLRPDRFYRKSPAEIDKLADSMVGPNGQLQPICVDEQDYLVFGLRRLEAAKRLGWKTIRTWRVDLADPLSAVCDENECRAALVVSDRVALGQLVEAAEAPRARANQTSGKNLAKGQEAGRSAERAAVAIGWSRPTYEAAKKVQERGTESLRQAVDDGLISVSDAVQVSGLAPEVQDAAVSAVRDGKAKTATQASKSTGKRSANAKSPEKKAEAALGIVMRFLEERGRYQKYEQALKEILREIQKS